MLKLPSRGLPYATGAGIPILNLDTDVVILSDNDLLPEIERAQFALHGFCVTEQPSYCVDLREFAKLVRKEIWKDAAS